MHDVATKAVLVNEALLSGLFLRFRVLGFGFGGFGLGVAGLRFRI